MHNERRDIDHDDLAEIWRGANIAEPKISVDGSRNTSKAAATQNNRGQPNMWMRAPRDEAGWLAGCNGSCPMPRSAPSER